MTNIKKLAVMGSDSSTNLEAIVRWFRGKNVDVTCISNIEDSAILKKAQELNIKQKYLPSEQNSEYFAKLENTRDKFDLIALTGYEKILTMDTLNSMGNVINVHPSLLPAFRGKDALKDAFLMGVKVSGITIHYVNNEIDGGKIVAQYPVFIANDMHFDEFEYEIQTIEKKLYPIVIEKVLNDQVFDFQDLMKSSCNNSSCGGSGCGGSCGSKSENIGNGDKNNDGE